VKRFVWLYVLVALGAPLNADVPDKPLPWRTPTCGLDFDRIPAGLTPSVALGLLHRRALALPGVVAVVEQYELAEAYPTLSEWLWLADSAASRLTLLRALATAGGGRLQTRELGALRSELHRIREVHEWQLAFEVLGRLHDAEIERTAFAQLRRRVAELEGEEGYQQGLTRRSLENLLHEGEFRLVGARREIQRVLLLPRAERLRAEARIYAGLSQGFEEYIGPWAASRLVRESWAAEPPEQFVRSNSAALRAEVAAALRATLSDLAAEQLDAEEAAWSRVKVVQAVSRLGGKLSGAERKFLQANSPGP
jgi:hypothetical protein